MSDHKSLYFSTPDVEAMFIAWLPVGQWRLYREYFQKSRSLAVTAKVLCRDQHSVQQDVDALVDKARELNHDYWCARGTPNEYRADYFEPYGVYTKEQLELWYKHYPAITPVHIVDGVRNYLGIPNPTWPEALQYILYGGSDNHKPLPAHINPVLIDFYRDGKKVRVTELQNALEEVLLRS